MERPEIECWRVRTIRLSCVLLCLVAASSGSARADGPASLIVDAELLDVGAPAPKPGATYVIALMRYKVLRVVRGSYKDSLIEVGHDMPDLGSPKFRVGARHRLELTTEFPKQATLLQSPTAVAGKSGIFFCTKFAMLASR
jgi:hypothetical protein